MLLPPGPEQDLHWKNTNLIITFVEEYLPSLMTAVSVSEIIQANKGSFCLASKPHDHMQYFSM